MTNRSGINRYRGRSRMGIRFVAMNEVSFDKSCSPKEAWMNNSRYPAWSWIVSKFFQGCSSMMGHFAFAVTTVLVWPKVMVGILSEQGERCKTSARGDNILYFPKRKEKNYQDIQKTDIVASLLHLQFQGFDLPPSSGFNTPEYSETWWPRAGPPTPSGAKPSDDEHRREGPDPLEQRSRLPICF